MRVIKNLVGAVLISIAVFLFWVLILPGYNEKTYLESVAESRASDLQIKSGILTKIEELDKQYQSRYAELKRLALVVPIDKHIDEMIVMFENIFSATGVPLSGMALLAGEEKAGEAYSLISSEFSFYTDYDSAINLINVVEKSLRLVDITSLAISREEVEGVESSIENLKVTFGTNSYFLNKNIKVNSSAQQPVVSE